jgi:hypothetical protein
MGIRRNTAVAGSILERIVEMVKAQGSLTLRLLRTIAPIASSIIQPEKPFRWDAASIMGALRSIHFEEARQISNSEAGALQNYGGKVLDQPCHNGNFNIEYDTFCNDRQVS